jgi:hypothetical protein
MCPSIAFPFFTLPLLLCNFFNFPLPLLVFNAFN